MKSKIKKGQTGIWMVVAVVLVLAGLWLAHHVHKRVHEQVPAADEANNLPTAAVSKVTRQDVFKQVTIPAEFRPYVEAMLNAKVSGYVNKMNVDFGDAVKAGQLLATIEVPELQDQLDNALATEQKAEADYTNADLIYTRLVAVNRDHPNLVAQQDLDTAEANDHSTAAAIAAAKAEVERYQTLVSYTNITAPFDGVITWRYADPGALIQAGTSSDSQSLPLVRVSDNYLLRLDFPVSEQYVQDISVGDAVQVRVESLGSKTFNGKVTRFTDKVDEDTRTMMVEIQVPNPNLKIVPGMYATVVLDVEKHANALVIPTQAVNPGRTASVLVVNQDDQLEKRAVTLGLETPDRYEVLSGLQEGDLVVVGDHSELQAGEKVEPKLVQLSMAYGNQDQTIQ
jgi:RND family efflux transporter MFP subunit